MPTRRKRGRWRKSSEIRKKRNLDFEQENLAPPTKLGSGPINLVATLIIGGIITAFFFIPSGNPKPKPKLDDPEKGPTSDVPSETFELLLPQKVLIKFRDAETPEERFEHLAHWDVVEERAREFFINGPGKDETIENITLLPEFSQLGNPATVRYLASLENGKKRLVHLIIPADSNPKIDFDFYARSGDVPWKDLIEGPALTSQEARVVLSEDHFYLGEFSDDKIWQSFKAESPDFEGSIVVYMKQDSPELERLLEIVAIRPVQANLALKTTETSRKTKQFEVTGINAFNWRTLVPGESQDD